MIICPYGELLLDRITQANLQDGVADSDIQTFYTYEDHSFPMGVNEAFVTLQFPSNEITPTKVSVYYLVMRDLRATEPQRIKLYSSTTESIFPDDVDIKTNDNEVVISSGTTPGNDNYEYMRQDLTISENEQVTLNYLRISLEFDAMTDWVFISEIEVYHMFESKFPLLCNIAMMAIVTNLQCQIPHQCKYLHQHHLQLWPQKVQSHNPLWFQLQQHHLYLLVSSR